MRLIALVLMLSLAAACAGSSRSDGAGAGGDPVEDARTALTFSIVGLAEGLVQSERQLDGIRHQTPRGASTKAALGEYAGVIAQLRASTTQVSMVTQDFDTRNPIVRQATEIVGNMVALANTVSGAAQTETAAYNRLADIDVAMDGVVAGWDLGGSVTQLRTAFRNLVTEANDLTEAAGGVQPVPSACSAQRDSRVRWGVLLEARTNRLAELIGPSTGIEYDSLRDQYRPLPYGDDRLAMDAADRACWLENSPVAGAEQKARTAITELQRLFAR
ncbi:MAG: hypothetical protein ACRDZO_25425 [Egibacteraceae bacterium]